MGIRSGKKNIGWEEAFDPPPSAPICMCIFNWIVFFQVRLEENSLIQSVKWHLSLQHVIFIYIFKIYVKITNSRDKYQFNRVDLKN